MLYYALVFLLVALVAGVLGFGMVAFAAAENLFLHFPGAVPVEPRCAWKTPRSEALTRLLHARSAGWYGK